MRFVEKCRLPTEFAEFDLYGFEDDDGMEHLAIVLGDLTQDEPVQTRIHSKCLTGDALFSLRCDCGAQLKKAMENIAERGRGLILYLQQEGRGIGLLNKIKAYQLQDQGMDTVEANQHLGFDADLRDYSMCKVMLEHLNVSQVELMTNNPKKVAAMKNMGVEVVSRQPIEVGVNRFNEGYLETKVDKLGHIRKISSVKQANEAD